MAPPSRTSSTSKLKPFSINLTWNVECCFRWVTELVKVFTVHYSPIHVHWGIFVNDKLMILFFMKTICWKWNISTQIMGLGLGFSLRHLSWNNKICMQHCIRCHCAEFQAFLFCAFTWMLLFSLCFFGPFGPFHTKHGMWNGRHRFCLAVVEWQVLSWKSCLRSL